MKKANAMVTSKLLLREHLLDANKSFQAIFNDLVVSPLRNRLQDVENTYEALPHPSGLLVRYRSKLVGLQEKTVITHRFFFPMQSETREKAFLLTQEQPEALSEMVIGLDSDQRGYFTICVYDSENYMLSTDTLVYNRQGDLFPYKSNAKMISPLQPHQVELYETINEQGARVLRFSVPLADLQAEATVNVIYQTSGINLRHSYVVRPEAPVLVHDLLLDNNPELSSGISMLIAADEQQRLLAEAYLYIRSAVDA